MTFVFILYNTHLIGVGNVASPERVTLVDGIITKCYYSTEPSEKNKDYLYWSCYCYHAL